MEKFNILNKQEYSCLTERRKKILMLRDEGFTLEEIGNYFNVTRERIRQIEKASRKKIQDSTL